MSLANDELDESQITSMDLPMDFKVNLIFSPLGKLRWRRQGPVTHKIMPTTFHQSFSFLSSATSGLVG
jgi:hypothetical protein